MIRMSWQGFLRRHKRTPAASILLSVGGKSPQGTESKLMTQYKRGQIDKDVLLFRLGLLDEWRRSFDESKPIVREYDENDWHCVGIGCWKRVNHIPEEYA